MDKLDLIINNLPGHLPERPQFINNVQEYSESAVIVPLIFHQNQWQLLFQVRSSQLKWQPGEICFPGGRIDPSDSDSKAAALRETREELGISAQELEVLGALNYTISPIGVVIHPYVVRLHYWPEKINSDEVDHLFSVPLSWLLTAKAETALMELATRPSAQMPSNLLPKGYSHEWHKRMTYPVLFYQYQNYTIWGLTARILWSFLEECRAI